MTAANVVPIRRALSRVEAEHLTDRIRSTAEELWALLLEAHDRRAWAALGYTSWSAYVAGEFEFSRSYAYRLLDQGRVIQALRGAVSPNGDTPTSEVVVSEAAARDLKPVLASVTEAVTKATRDVPPERLAQVVRQVVARERRKAAAPEKPTRTRDYTVSTPTVEEYLAEAERLEAEARRLNPVWREEVARLTRIADRYEQIARTPGGTWYRAKLWERERDARQRAQTARDPYDRLVREAWGARACAWQLQRRQQLAAPPLPKPSPDDQRRLRELWQACHEQAGHDPVGTKLLLRAALDAARARLAEQPEGTAR